MEFQILQQLLFEHPHAPPLIVELRGIIQRFLQVRAVNRFWQKVRRSAPDRFQRRIQRVIPGHQQYMHAGIALQRLAQEFVAVHCRHVHVDQREPASPPA